MAFNLGFVLFFLFGRIGTRGEPGGPAAVVGNREECFRSGSAAPLRQLPASFAQSFVGLFFEGGPSSGIPGGKKGRFRGPLFPVRWPTPADSAMWRSRSHKMPASDMAAAPLLPRPAEELKMAAARKCGAERNARQRRKRRPSGNAARAGTPPPVAFGSSSFSPSRYIILLPWFAAVRGVSLDAARWRLFPFLPCPPCYPRSAVHIAFAAPLFKIRSFDENRGKNNITKLLPCPAPRR